jgi:hypothetical protein
MVILFALFNMVMVFSKFRLASINTFLLLPLLFSQQPLLAQTSPETDVEIPEASSEDTTPEAGSEETPETLRPDTLLSLEGGEQLMSEATAAIEEENYDLAKEKLQSARRILNQLSNFYQQLAGSFQGISNQVSQEQRQQAVQAAEMRDRATYQLALVHRAQQETALAVPLLIQVIRSQNPTSELGRKSYQQLRELGFVKSPFPGSN